MCKFIYLLSNTKHGTAREGIESRQDRATDAVPRDAEERLEVESR